MLSFFRRILFSPVGVVITLLFLGLIALAFGIGDVLGSRVGSGGPGSTTAATVGKQTVTTGEVVNSTNGMLNMYRQQSQQLSGLTMAEFVAKGGLDGPFENRLTGMAMEQLGNGMGMRVSRALMDNEIGQIPGMRGIDGKVDPARYGEFLGLIQLTDAQMHAQIARDVMTRLLLGPIAPNQTSKIKAPATIATPYASMLLEQRTGTVAFVDTKKMPAGAAPTDAEAQGYYRTNIARYTLPERRSAKYALLTIDEIKKRAAPTDAEIAKAFQSQSARFAATETRSMKQVVLLDQKAAADLAAKVRAGTAIDAAAKAAGLEAATVSDVTKDKYATQSSSPALADQVFAAASGAVIGPVKTSLGWAVVHLDTITKVPAKTLDQAKPDIVKELTDQKTQAFFQQIRDQVDEAIGNHQTFEQIAAALKLSVQTAPALTVDGKDPTAATPVTPDPKLASLYQLAFQTEVDDDPQLVPLGQDGTIALAKLDRVIPAAPRPFATVADQVKKDITIDRQVKSGRDVAKVIVDKVNKGMPLAQAMKESGIALDGTKPMAANRAQLFTTKQPPAPLILLFSKPRGSASMLQAPYKGGWFIVVVDSVQRGDATGKQDMIEKMRGDLGSGAGDELRQQFAAAVRTKVGIKKNDAALKAVRDQLLGASNEDQPQ